MKMITYYIYLLPESLSLKMTLNKAVSTIFYQKIWFGFDA